MGMRKFRMPFVTLERLRRVEKEHAQLALIREQNRLSELERILSLSRETYHQVLEEEAELRLNRPDPTLILHYSTFEQILREQISRQVEDARAQAKKVEKSRADLHQKLIRHKVVKRLQSLRKARWLRELARLEQKLLDEVAQNQRQRRAESEFYE